MPCFLQPLSQTLFGYDDSNSVLVDSSMTVEDGNYNFTVCVNRFGLLILSLNYEGVNFKVIKTLDVFRMVHHLC